LSRGRGDFHHLDNSASYWTDDARFAKEWAERYYGTSPVVIELRVPQELLEGHHVIKYDEIPNFLWQQVSSLSTSLNLRVFLELTGAYLRE
jgi:hypothetical protein